MLLTSGCAQPLNIPSDVRSCEHIALAKGTKGGASLWDRSYRTQTR